MLKKETASKVEYRFKCKDGNYKWIELTAINRINDPAINGVLLNYHDITERKQVEKSIQEKTEQVNAIVESSQEWIWAINLKGIHTYSNPAVEQILGYPAKKLVGKPIFDLMHEDDRKMIATNMPLWISEKRGWKAHVVRWKHINGEWRYLESSAVPIIDVNGNVSGFRGVDRDITQRKQAEEEKTKIFNSIQTGIYIYDIGKSINEYINPEYTKLIGFTLDDQANMGKKITESFHPDDIEQVAKHQKIVSEDTEDNTHIIEYRFKHKNGQWRWFLSYDTPFQRNANGEVEKMIGSFIDITDRKKMEETLQESEIKYRTLVDNSIQGVIVAQNNPIRLVFANSMMEKITGYTVNELTTMTPEKLALLIHSDDRVRFFNNFQKRISGDKIKLRNNYRFITKKKEKKWVEISSSLINYLNEPATLTAFVDITERKVAELELEKHRQHLEALVKERTKELEEKNVDLQRFHDATIEREFRIKELSDEIDALKSQLNK